MTFEWLKIIASGLIGFLGACVVQFLSLFLQERRQKKLLRESLYRELVTIYIGLRDLLPMLNVEGAVKGEGNPANLPEFVKAECFNTAKSSPVFWRLKDAFAIMQAHRGFGYLAVYKPSDVGAAAGAVRVILDGFRGMVNSARLSRTDLLRCGDNRVLKAEFIQGSSD